MRKTVGACYGGRLGHQTMRRGQGASVETESNANAWSASRPGRCLSRLLLVLVSLDNHLVPLRPPPIFGTCGLSVFPRCRRRHRDSQAVARVEPTKEERDAMFNQAITEVRPVGSGRSAQGLCFVAYNRTFKINDVYAPPYE